MKNLDIRTAMLKHKVTVTELATRMNRTRVFVSEMINNFELDKSEKQKIIKLIERK